MSLVRALGVPVRSAAVGLAAFALAFSASHAETLEKVSVASFAGIFYAAATWLLAYRRVLGTKVRRRWSRGLLWRSKSWIGSDLQPISPAAAAIAACVGLCFLLIWLSWLAYVGALILYEQEPPADPFIAVWGYVSVAAMGLAGLSAVATRPALTPSGIEDEADTR